MQIKDFVRFEPEDEKRLKTCLKVIIKYGLRNPNITSEDIWNLAKEGRLTEKNVNLPQVHLDKWLNRIYEWFELSGEDANLSNLQLLVEQERERKEEARKKRQAIIERNREIVYGEQGNVCFVDFEYTAESAHELLSIGAVVTDNKQNRLDCFYQTVKPRLNKKLSSFTRKITKLEQNEINNSADFSEVIADFLDFLHRNQVKQMYVWGDWDRLALMRNIEVYGYEGLFRKWVEQMIDLQRIIITDLPSTNNQWGLEKMKMIYGIDSVVIHHALSDALDLCDVFIATQKQKPNLEIARGFLDGTISLPEYTKAEKNRLIEERTSRIRTIYVNEKG